MRTHHVLALAAIVATGFATAPAFASELVANGSFEANTGDGTCATGWTCSSAYFSEEPVGFWNSQQAGSDLSVSPEGGNVLATWYIDKPETISQTLTGLVAGTTYKLSFDAAIADRSTTPNAPGTMGWQVSVGAAMLGNADMSIPGAQSATPWSTQGYAFVTDASSEVLRFLSESSVAVAPEPILLLDGVSVQPQVAPVPEPATWALSLGGLAAVLFMARRRSGRDGVA